MGKIKSPLKGKKANEFNGKVEGDGNGKYVLKLYVTGTTPNSLRSIKNLRELCEKYLNNNYDLEIIDIYQQPQLSLGEQIIAAPTLIKKLPLPLRKFIGDLSDLDKVLFGLNVEKKS